MIAAFSYEVIMRNLNGSGIVLLQNSVECGFTFFGMKAFSAALRCQGRRAGFLRLSAAAGAAPGRRY